MGINKNAYIRYKTLDKCFRNKYEKFAIKDLLEEVNNELIYFYGKETQIKKRQLFDDIKFMESESGWAISLERIREGRKTYYRYSDNNFSIRNKKISDNEIDTINSALMVLSRFNGLPQFEWINELSTKLKSQFELNDAPEVISFDHNEFLEGLEYLPNLYKSITEQYVLSIEYQAFYMDESENYIIHPYYLKQYNKRWFLFGLNHDNKQIYNIPLDRIKSVKKINKVFIINETIDFKEYFEDMIGVSRKSEDKPIKITLSFDKETAPYIITKPIHGSQKKIKYDDNELIIQIEVIQNYELRQLILSYGNSVKVLSPESYSNAITLLKNY